MPSQHGAHGWEVSCAQKREKRDNAIPEVWRIQDLDKLSSTQSLLGIPATCGILTDKELHITSDYDAVELVDAIRKQVFTAEAVTTAFCKRAAIAQQLVGHCKILSYLRFTNG